MAVFFAGRSRLTSSVFLCLRHAPRSDESMNFVLHGTTLALAWFLVVNLAASALVVWISTRRLRTTSPAFWFAVRILPACAATLFVTAVFLPSYWRYEPRDTMEGFDLTLTDCA